MKLAKSEEQLMQYLWELETAFLSDLLEKYPEPKPASSTVATLLKRMNQKEFIDYEQMGRSRRYYPLVTKAAYFSKHINKLIKNYFNDSPSTFASFFTRETDLSGEELEELQEIINNQLKKQNND